MRSTAILHLYFNGKYVIILRWGGHVARKGKERVLVGETGGKETNGET